jgi:hypothetical protein
VQPLIERTPEGKLRYHFHLGQIRAWDSTKRIVAIIAGGRSGKSSFGPLWLHREMQAKGPGDYLVAAPNFPLIDKYAGPEVEMFFEKLMGYGRMLHSRPPSFKFSREGIERLWGVQPDRPPRIIFGHADEPQSIEAFSGKSAWLDEAGQDRFKLASFEAVQQRVSVDQGRILITSKPYNFGWLKTQIHDPWKAANRNHPRIDVISFSSLENPIFPREEWDNMQATLPKWKFDMQYRGIFTKPAGIIFDCFEEPAGQHVIQRFAIPPLWQRYIGLDFGSVNMAAVMLAAEADQNGNRSGRYIVYQSHHPATKHTPGEHIAMMRQMEPNLGSATGGAGSEDEWRDDFGRHGLYVGEPPIRDVEVGIDRTYALIKERRLLVFSDLLDVIEELQTYSRELDLNGTPTEKIENKTSFHLTDALRYICARLNPIGPIGPQILSGRRDIDVTRPVEGLHGFAGLDADGRDTFEGNDPYAPGSGFGRRLN